MALYLFFEIQHYYPAGGMHDCEIEFTADSDEEAIARALRYIGEDYRKCDEYELYRADAERMVMIPLPDPPPLSA